MGHLQRLLLATALGLSVMPAAQAQLPSGSSVRSGRVGIQRSGNELIIRSASERSVINWNRFSIGPDQIVTYYQPSRSSTVLNQVTGGIRSVISGLLQSCLSGGGECRPTEGRGTVGGGVILVNPAGISVLGGHIITDHTLLTTAGINVQQFIDSGVINLTLAGDGLIEIGKGATLSGPLKNPSGLEGLAVVAPRIVVDGSVNLPEASGFVVQPQAKGLTPFVFNNVRPSRSFLKLDPGVHHSGVSTVHEESDRTRWFLLNGAIRTSDPCPAGAEGTSDCYSVTEHLTTDSTLKREFPLKTYTVATLPAISSSLWSVLPWAITSTRLETTERPPGIEPASGCEPNGGENGSGEAVCVRDGLARFQRRQREWLTAQSTLLSLQPQPQQRLSLEATADGRVLLKRASSEQEPEEPQEEPNDLQAGGSCPAEPGLQAPSAPLQSRESVQKLLLETLVAGELVKPNSQIIPESIPPLDSLCNGDGQTVQVMEPGADQPKTVPIGGCLQLTAVRSGCEAGEGGASQSPGAINFTLGSHSPATQPDCNINEPESCLGHITDRSPVSFAVTSGSTTQMLNSQGEPINGCGSRSTLIAPLPQVLWNHLLDSSTQISTDPAGSTPTPNGLATGGERQGQLQSFRCDGVLKPVDPKLPAHLQNILQAGAGASAPGSVLSCTYQESCSPPGLARIQSRKLFELPPGQTMSTRLLSQLISRLQIKVKEGDGFNAITLPPSAPNTPQTAGAVVPAGQPLQLAEQLDERRTVSFGGKTYSTTAQPKIEVNPGGQQSSFVPQAGQEYVVTYTNKLEVKDQPRPLPNQPKYVYPCLEISKTGCSEARLEFRPSGPLRSIYGGNKTITMLANGGPHRMCPLAASSSQQRSGTIDLRELNAVPQTTASSPLPGLQTRSSLNAGASFSVSGVPQEQGQPAPLRLTLANPECRGGPGTSACVKFEKQWIGAPPANAGSPLISLKRDGEAPLTVSQESGQKCYGNLQPGETFTVSASEQLVRGQRDVEMVQATDQVTVKAGQAEPPVLRVVNRAKTNQKCIRVEKRLEVQGQPQASSQTFKANLIVQPASSKPFQLDLTPGQAQVKCFDRRELQSFVLTETLPSDAAVVHYQTLVDGVAVASGGQAMARQAVRGNNANVVLVNVPKSELVGQACLEVQKLWLKNGQPVDQPGFPGVSSIKAGTPGQEQEVLADLKSQGLARRCQVLRQGETWRPQVVETNRAGGDWQPSIGAITATSRQSVGDDAQPQAFGPSVNPSGNAIKVSGLNIIAGNTDRVTLVNEYRPSVRVPAGMACLRVRKQNAGMPPAGAAQVGLTFLSSVPLSVPNAQGKLVQQPGRQAPYRFSHNLDLAQGSYAPIVCYEKSNFSGDIRLVETLPAGVKPDAVTPTPNAAGEIVVRGADLKADTTLDLNIVNDYYQRPPQPREPLVPELPQRKEPPKLSFNAPIAPSCISVSKQGDAPGVFSLQLSAGSVLTTGSMQFVLGPSQTQQICAVSADAKVPVRFAVSESPAPGSFVSGLLVNGQPQAPAGDGNSSKIATVSVFPNGSATLSFQNRKNPIPIPQPTPQRVPPLQLQAKPNPQPTPPSCVTVTKSGAASGAFNVVLSAGSVLTTGAQQFVLQPQQSQLLCAISPDPGQPVRFAVSETPAADSRVAAVRLDGQPQPLAVDGAATTTSLSLAPNAEATLAFENRGVPVPTPQPLRSPIPLPPGVRFVPQPRPLAAAGLKPPLPLRFSRFDQQQRAFVFVIPGGPELPVSESAMEQLPLQVSHGGRLFELRRPQLVRGLY